MVELKNSAGSTLTTKKILADFYRHGNTADMKDSYEIALGSLAMGSYTVTVTAYDSWDAASSATLSFEITEQGVSPSELPEAYVDINFDGGTITDAKGNVTVTNNGATAGQTSVTLGGNTYTVDALQITESGQYVLCEFKNLANAAQMKAWAEGGFAVEAFYVMGDKGGDGQGMSVQQSSIRYLPVLAAAGALRKSQPGERISSRRQAETSISAPMRLQPPQRPSLCMWSRSMITRIRFSASISTVRR